MRPVYTSVDQDGQLELDPLQYLHQRSGVRSGVMWSYFDAEYITPAKWKN